MSYTSSLNVRNKENKVNISTPKRRRGREKGRSITTYQHKLRKIKRQYKNLARPNTNFLKKYPTVEKYLKSINIKEATRGE